MLNPKPIYRTAGFWRRVVPGVLVLLWIILFWRDLAVLYTFIANGAIPPIDPIQQFELVRAVLAIMLTFLGLGVYYTISLWLVSQFVLPVQTATERRLIYERIIRYLSSAHGAAVFIREGQIVGSMAELQSSLPGVAFVDTKSAIVLERQPFISQTGGRVGRHLPLSNRVLQSVENIVEGPQVSPNALARAAGPGLVFTSAGERIRGVVSLRQHVRAQPNVRSMTKDGFEVAATIVAIFSLGEPPEVIRVGYTLDNANDPDPYRPENIRAIQVDDKTKKISRFVEELDLPDQREVHNYAQRAQPAVFPQGARQAARSKVQNTPYLFDPDRVFRAIYSDARRTNDDGVESWVDLPLRVAIETYHNAIATVRYADLYMPENPNDFPMVQSFRPRISREVRNQGVLSYQFVRHKNGQPFLIGEVWNEADLEIYPVQPLRGSKVLRDRGIRLIVTSFAEISPVNPVIRQQLLDFWRSKHQREADLVRVHYDVEEIQIRAHARALAQRDIVMSLKGILENTSITSEAMAFQVMQALEQFAKDPATEQLLPHEALGMMNNLHNWIWGTTQNQNLASDPNLQVLLARYPVLPNSPSNPQDFDEPGQGDLK